MIRESILTAYQLGVWWGACYGFAAGATVAALAMAAAMAVRL